ncbi:MALR1 protein, partial [Malurus elegans]|nr:MALR1 protein [Malurus elegans]
LLHNIPGSCNFEAQDQEWTTVCGLTQDSADNFDWNFSNSAAKGQTGPDTDHTPVKARVFVCTINFFPANLGVCTVCFWFWMFASRQTGVLKV